MNGDFQELKAEVDKSLSLLKQDMKSWRDSHTTNSSQRWGTLTEQLNLVTKIISAVEDKLHGLNCSVHAEKFSNLTKVTDEIKALVISQKDTINQTQILVANAFRNLQCKSYGRWLWAITIAISGTWAALAIVFHVLTGS